MELWRMALSRAPFHWPLYALVLTAVYGWRATQRGHIRERRAAELERLLTEARLTGLSRQLHPHFLFNTLNTIVEYVRSDPARAEEMLLDLSDLLRHALRAADRHVVPLAEELSLLDLYLDIQRARFGPRLLVERRIEPAVLAAGVPVLLLQPLVENALRHGLDESDVPVTVTLEAHVQDERLRLAVLDDARGGAGGSAGEGIGLANIRQRLTALYGEAFRFEAGPRCDGGFAVEFIFPLQPCNAPPLSP
jgi:LytS/YehU family sensor histidine kinase